MEQERRMMTMLSNIVYYCTSTCFNPIIIQLNSIKYEEKQFHKSSTLDIAVLYLLTPTVFMYMPFFACFFPLFFLLLCGNMLFRMELFSVLNLFSVVYINL